MLKIKKNPKSKSRKTNFSSILKTGALIFSISLAATSLLLLRTQLRQPTQLESDASNQTSTPVVPGDLLDLSGWYLTLPEPVQNPPKKIEPYTVVMGGQTSKQVADDLRTYSSQWFHLNQTKDGVTFKAPTNGATTTNSFNPRSELREMTNGGKTKAAWASSTSNKDNKVHSMYIEQSVSHLPVKKPHVVIGQIHDGSDDVTVFRLKGNQLCITDGDNTCAFTAGTVELNQRFSVKMEMVNGVISYYFNGNKLPYTKTKNISGAYFKAGMYTQSTCDPNAGSQYAGDTCDAYGENTIYVLEVCHDGVCIGNQSGKPTTPVSPQPTVSISPSSTPVASSSPLPSASVTPNTTGVVTGLKATSTKDSVVNLSWNAYPGASKYKVFMDKYHTGVYTSNNSTSSTKFVYKNLKSKQKSYFKIQAYDKNGTQIGTSSGVGVMVK